MNLERLKALIRLANNNPNEHEANLAARKVCKIIAEKDFSLLQPQPRTAAGKVNEYRSRPTAPTVDMWEDFLRNMRYRPSESQKKYWTDSAPHQDAPEPHWDDRPFNINMDPNKKKERTQAKRKCSKCGFETMTFRIDEVPWICNPCHWKDVGL